MPKDEHSPDARGWRRQYSEPRWSAEVEAAAELERRSLNPIKFVRDTPGQFVGALIFSAMGAGFVNAVATDFSESQTLAPREGRIVGFIAFVLIFAVLTWGIRRKGWWLEDDEHGWGDDGGGDGGGD